MSTWINKEKMHFVETFVLIHDWKYVEEIKRKKPLRSRSTQWIWFVHTCFCYYILLLCVAFYCKQNFRHIHIFRLIRFSFNLSIPGFHFIFFTEQYGFCFQERINSLWVKLKFFHFQHSLSFYLWNRHSTPTRN